MLRYRCEWSITIMIYWGDFLCDLLDFGSWSFLFLEGVFGARFFSGISQLHFIFLCVVFMSLVQVNLGLGFCYALRLVFPPLLWSFCLSILREDLTMDSDRLITKLLNALLDHSNTALLVNFCSGLASKFFLRQPQYAVFSVVKTLFGIPCLSNFILQILELC